MNSSAEALIDTKSDKSNLRKNASFPVCSFNSVIADFAFSSLRTAMYTFALCLSNSCMCFTRLVIESLLKLKTYLCCFLSNPYLQSSLHLVLARIRLWNTPVFAPVTMITFPVKSGMSVTLNLAWGGKAWWYRDKIMPMVRIGIIDKAKEEYYQTLY